MIQTYVWKMEIFGKSMDFPTLIAETETSILYHILSRYDNGDYDKYLEPYNYEEGEMFRTLLITELYRRYASIQLNKKIPDEIIRFYKYHLRFYSNFYAISCSDYEMLYNI